MPPKISPESISKARQLPTVDVLARLGISTKRTSKANEYLCKCPSPSHADHRPSCRVYAEHVHCYACEYHADNIKLAMDCQSLNFAAAVSWLLDGAIAIASTATTDSDTTAPTGAPLDYMAYRNNIRPYYAQVRAKGAYSPLFAYLRAVAPGIDWAAAQVRYRCGSINGWELFPYLDRYNTLHQIKHMKYGADGHRLKTEHSIWIEKDKHYKCPSLFGAHLVDDSVQTLYIVESEKTALICSTVQPYRAIYGDGVWLATGGKGQLTAAKLIDYHGKAIVLCPDVDAMGDWHTVAVDLLAKGHKVAIAELDKVCNPDSKLDLADIVLQALTAPEAILKTSNSAQDVESTNVPPTAPDASEYDLNSVKGVHAYMLAKYSDYASFVTALDLRPTAGTKLI